MKTDFFKHEDWAFGIRLSQNVHCMGEYIEYEFWIDLYKWSFGFIF